jgi:hypothetical protein
MSLFSTLVPEHTPQAGSWNQVRAYFAPAFASLERRIGGASFAASSGAEGRSVARARPHEIRASRAAAARAIRRREKASALLSALLQRRTVD